MRYPIPFFLLAFIAFCAVLAIRRKKQADRQFEANEAFLERERAANATRKKDISNLDYLPFSIDRLPAGTYSDDALASYEAVFQKLSGQKIINLSRYSNTDLKLMYGPANLNSLTEYDDNYHELAAALSSYAARQEALGRREEAIAVLEYAMELKIDSSQIYVKLAGLYEEQGMPEKIQTVEQALASMDKDFAAMTLSKLSAFHTAG